MQDEETTCIQTDWKICGSQRFKDSVLLGILWRERILLNHSQFTTYCSSIITHAACSITFCSRVGLILMVVSFQVHVEHMNQVLDCGLNSRSVWITKALSKFIPLFSLFSFLLSEQCPDNEGHILTFPKGAGLFSNSMFVFLSNEMRHGLKVHSPRWMRQHARYQWCILMWSVSGGPPLHHLEESKETMCSPQARWRR